MIFPVIQNEDIVQVNDKTRLDGSSSYKTPDEASITLVEIQPETGADFFDVTSNDYKLDWQYSTSGEKTISIRITTDASPETTTSTIQVVTEESDNLYSSDEQIFEIENELKRYIPNGRNSYKNVHREAQSRILNYLERKNLRNEDGTPYTKDQLNLQGQVSKWSLYEAIYMIYSDLYISVGDKFLEKMNQYKTLRNNQRDLGVLRIDRDKDGTIQPEDEFQDMKTFRMIKR